MVRATTNKGGVDIDKPSRVQLYLESTLDRSGGICHTINTRGRKVFEREAFALLQSGDG